MTVTAITTGTKAARKLRHKIGIRKGGLEAAPFFDAEPNAVSIRTVS